METKNAKKNTPNFICEKCDFKCSKRSDWDRHIVRPKHNFVNEEMVKTQKNTSSKCTCDNCGKTYKYYSGLWKHKKNCERKSKPVEDKNTIDLLINENKDFKNIILELVKNNGDFQKQMLEMCKGSNNTIIANNSHNKTFNLQVFLNETCKDAMNMVDFVNSMTLELSDLEEVGNLGYVEGISNIIIRKLNALDVCKRPIHCSDAKREIIYVKEDDVWEKENNGYDKLRKVVKQVTYKNSSLLVPWSQKYPNCMNNQHSLNDVYVKMMGQAMGGKESFLDSENKIMKKIAKAVLIEK
jgi:hypothetical protein